MTKIISYQDWCHENESYLMDSNPKDIWFDLFTLEVECTKKEQIIENLKEKINSLERKEKWKNHMM
jgi:CII-binding regulator of phage lambda lysogenization HflD